MQTTPTSWNPRVMIGANSASLNPLVPSPVYRPAPVAIEIEPGIGFGIDGETLVVSDGVAEGTTTIGGRFPDGTYPQRDFVVVRHGSETTIDGFYDWQDYTLRRSGNKVDVACGNPDFSASITDGPNGPVGAGPFAAQSYQVTSQGNQTRVQGFDDMHSATIVRDGDKMKIIGAVPERSFELTRTPNGFHVQGELRTQDFDVTRTADGFVIQGHYPHQRYVVRHTSA